MNKPKKKEQFWKSKYLVVKNENNALRKKTIIMKHATVTNIPIKPKELYDYALSKSYNSWIDEKGTLNNPSVWTRSSSKLTYEQAFPIIQNNKPHWVISFRNNSHFGDEDYWEFGGCNIASNDYGEVFIWIQVKPDVVDEIFKKFKLKLNEY